MLKHPVPLADVQNFIIILFLRCNKGAFDEARRLLITTSLQESARRPQSRSAPSEKILSASLNRVDGTRRHQKRAGRSNKRASAPRLHYLTAHTFNLILRTESEPGASGGLNPHRACRRPQTILRTHGFVGLCPDDYKGFFCRPGNDILIAGAPLINRLKELRTESSSSGTNGRCP
jgi:hypothetical protein